MPFGLANVIMFHPVTCSVTIALTSFLTTCGPKITMPP